MFSDIIPKFLLNCVCLDQRDASNDAWQSEWAGAHVYRASHRWKGSRDGTFEKPTHRWSWRETGLLQPGGEWVKNLFLRRVYSDRLLEILLFTIIKLSLLAEAAAFDEEWRRELGRYRPPTARSLDYGRDRNAGVGQQLALTAPPSSSSPPPRHESPRHHPPQSRPRYDWWEVSLLLTWMLALHVFYTARLPCLLALPALLYRWSGAVGVEWSTWCCEKKWTMRDSEEYYNRWVKCLIVLNCFNMCSQLLTGQCPGMGYHIAGWNSYTASLLCGISPGLCTSYQVTAPKAYTPAFIIQQLFNLVIIHTDTHTHI